MFSPLTGFQLTAIIGQSGKHVMKRELAKVADIPRVSIPHSRLRWPRSFPPFHYEPLIADY
jgi:hypothetical protein